MLKNYVFIRESANFDDILNDPVLKKDITQKIKAEKLLILGITNDDAIGSYIYLRYGDDIKPFSDIVPDRSPRIDKDYIPKNRPERFKKQ